MSFVLFKKEWKNNGRIWLLIAAVLTMYVSVVVAMYDPKLGESLNMMAEAMPQLFAAFGMGNPGLTLLDFVTNYLYGFILILFPFIYTLIMCHRLMARYIDRGSMAYLLATPISRSQIVLTQLAVLVSGLVLLLFYVLVLILLCTAFMFSEEFDILSLVLTQAGLLSLHLLLAGICYLSVCSFNEVKKSVGIGAGCGILFILIDMLSKVSDKISFLRYLTPVTLFDAKALQANEINAYLGCMLMVLLFVICVYTARKIFMQRDLPL